MPMHLGAVGKTACRSRTLGGPVAEPMLQRSREGGAQACQRQFQVEARAPQLPSGRCRLEQPRYLEERSGSARAVQTLTGAGRQLHSLSKMQPHHFRVVSGAL